MDLAQGQDGLLTATFATDSAMAGTVQATLVVQNRGDRAGFDDAPMCVNRPTLVLLQSAPMAVDLGVQGEQDMELPMPLTSRLDRIQNPSTMDLRLVIDFTLDRASTSHLVERFLIAPGASLRVPLEEYHADAPRLPEGGVSVVPLQDTRVYRNPGSTALFRFDTAPDAAYELLGKRAAWAQVVASPDGGVAVVVEVPEDAEDGTIADLVLQVQPMGSDAVGLARMTVEVDTEAAHPDDAAAAAALAVDGKESPGPSLVAVLALLVGAVVHRHRSRR